jgi:hypothetical protein
MGTFIVTNSSSDNGAEFGNVDGSFNILANELYRKDRMDGVKSQLITILRDSGSKNCIASDLGS